ncbi:DUF1345 domain-containing protein [Fibrivirga algicola]|uniref:DUF1345 domain-containing protein n=1 Tax=Fibrivirga algicola TaxID=2950420 RepID=A0ABX0QFW3_9BACT|nr:DUF1345 domain-containing protein [Fibrivirga algicola]ARK10797.1 hypothetical protein A6C57_10935 [Fibrella sp. ES10-3-2-2]NID09967.1 DUF1345 domain-containing protein [Fibrivirga algicola]
MLKQIARLDAHHRLAIGLGISLITYLISSQLVIWPIQVLLMYVSYALTTNVLAWVSMTYLLPHETRQTYRIQDSSRILILSFAIFAAVASLFAVIFLLNSVKTLHPVHLQGYVALSVLTVISSWTLLHTLFTLRYAHLYYQHNPAGGLNFPDTKQPGYADFAYVAFGIGMTSQVADVGPTTAPFRRLILTHSLLSFGFNTLIVALSINVVASLL